MENRTELQTSESSKHRILQYRCVSELLDTNHSYSQLKNLKHLDTFALLTKLYTNLSKLLLVPGKCEK